jgi:hypothetical protein
VSSIAQSKCIFYSSPWGTQWEKSVSDHSSYQWNWYRGRAETVIKESGQGNGLYCLTKSVLATTKIPKFEWINHLEFPGGTDATNIYIFTCTVKSIGHILRPNGSLHLMALVFLILTHAPPTCGQLRDSVNSVLQRPFLCLGGKGEGRENSTAA